MKKNEVIEQLHILFGELYANGAVSNGLYGEEKKNWDKRMEEVRNACGHVEDDGESAIEAGYCNICGKKMEA